MSVVISKQLLNYKYPFMRCLNFYLNVYILIILKWLVGSIYLFILILYCGSLQPFQVCSTLKEKRTSQHGIFSCSSFFTLQKNKPETSLIIVENAMWHCIGHEIIPCFPSLPTVFRNPKVNWTFVIASRSQCNKSIGITGISTERHKSERSRNHLYNIYSSTVAQKHRQYRGGSLLSH